MTERKTENSLPTQEQIAEAMGRYKKLLDHHNIDQDVQDAVWVSILEQMEENPIKIVSEIQSYWENTFGTNGAKRLNSGSDVNGKYRGSNSNNRASLAEVIYNRRRNWRNESVNISKEGSKIKARKKARKAYR